MVRIFEYYGRYQGFRTRLTTLPAVARFILLLLALPGLILVALSFLALGVSILALLLLTVPAYRLLAAIAGRPVPRTQGPAPAESPPVSPGRRHVDVRIVDETAG